MIRNALTEVDRPLVVTVVLLAALGTYNLASAAKPLGSSLHVTHSVHLAVGLLLGALVVSVHYRNLEGLAYPILVVVVILLIATSLFGKVVNGSRRWLELGSLTLQTSDAAKLAVIIAVAKTLHRMRWEGGLTLRTVFRPLNVSRPLLVVIGVIAFSLFGEQIKPAKLSGKRGLDFRTVKTLGPGTPVLALGSAASADGVLRVRGSGVEPVHAQLLRHGDSRYVFRPASENTAVFVNGTQILEPTELAHGDILRLGQNARAELRFAAPAQRLRSGLPYLALFGSLWLFLASYLQFKKRRIEFEEVLAPIDVVAIPSVLILVQPDLGTAVVVLLIAFSMLLFVGLRPSSLFLLSTGGAAAAVLAWLAILKPYQKQRVLSFLDPTSDLAGAGYHQHQSLIAIGSGRMWGKGHGQGTQTQLSFLPEQQTDFIFSVWAEEQGFAGSFLLVALFAALIVLSIRVAVRARDHFGALLAFGVTAMLFWHAIINILMVLRLAPVVGVPLPLWSHGGSFLVTTMVGLALLFNVDMRRRMF